MSGPEGIEGLVEDGAGALGIDGGVVGVRLGLFALGLVRRGQTPVVLALLRHGCVDGVRPLILGFDRLWLGFRLRLRLDRDRLRLDRDRLRLDGGPPRACPEEPPEKAASLPLRLRLLRHRLRLLGDRLRLLGDRLRLLGDRLRLLGDRLRLLRRLRDRLLGDRLLSHRLLRFFGSRLVRLRLRLLALGELRVQCHLGAPSGGLD
jgi:hypothetical protein